jgi:hypothetical protein
MITLAALNVLHFWIVFVATGVLLAVLAWAGGRRRKLSPKQLAAGGIPAACGSCGYDLTGLPGHICPECGSDLDLVGRLSPRFRLWSNAPVTARVIIWTVAIAGFGAGFMHGALEGALPRQQQLVVHGNWTLEVPVPGEQLPDRPNTYSAIRVRLVGHFTRRAWPTDPSYVAHAAVIPDRSCRFAAARLELDFYEPPEIAEWQNERHYTHRKIPGQGVVYLSRNDQSEPEVSKGSREALSPALRAKFPANMGTAEALLLTLDQAGYDNRHRPADELAADLAQQMDNFLRYGGASPPQTGSVWMSRDITRSTSPWRLGTVMNAGNMTRLEQVPTLMAGSFWLAIWLTGLPFILRKRPLSIRRPEAGPANAGEKGLMPSETEARRGEVSVSI